MKSEFNINFDTIVYNEKLEDEKNIIGCHYIIVFTRL